MKYCIHCGSEMSDEAVFCGNCGKGGSSREKEEEKMYCENCGDTIGVNAEYCPKCGTVVTKGRVTLKEMKDVMKAKKGGETPKNQYQENPETQTVVNISIAGYDPKWDYTPIGMWGYFWYSILFIIPIIGCIFLIVFALGGTRNINLRNYARSYFCIIILLGVVGLSLIGAGFGAGFASLF